MQYIVENSCKKMQYRFFEGLVKIFEVIFFKTPPYTMEGFDLTTLAPVSSVAGADDTTRPHRRGNFSRKFTGRN
jgi:hypothetical protein